MGSFWWEKITPSKIGISCRNLRDIEVYSAAKEIDILELKIYKMEKDGFPLYQTDDGEHYYLNQVNAKKLKKILKGKPFQVHMPFEGSTRVKNERKLYQARAEDHPALVSRQRAIAELFKLTRNKGICVWHPGRYVEEGVEIAAFEDACRNANSLYKRLESRILEESWPIQPTLENQAAPKKKSEDLGYEAEHFWHLARGTRIWGMTFDTGHANLTFDSARKIIGSGLRICSVHLHGNHGLYDPNSFKDDEHEFATRKNIKGYVRWMDYFRRFGPTIILETKKYEPEETLEYVRKLRKELNGERGEL